ncbi:hypothetical protein ABBQ38_009499 [Trebouxia sp. C0009 RCD-2024]
MQGFHLIQGKQPSSSVGDRCRLTIWLSDGPVNTQLTPASEVASKRLGCQHIQQGGQWAALLNPVHCGRLVERQPLKVAEAEARKHGILAPGTLTCQPRLLPSLGSDLTPTEVLQALESRWTASMHASPASRARLSSDMPTSQPAWMAVTRGHRQHWSQR